MTVLLLYEDLRTLEVPGGHSTGVNGGVKVGHWWGAPLRVDRSGGQRSEGDGSQAPDDLNSTGEPG